MSFQFSDVQENDFSGMVSSLVMQLKDKAISDKKLHETISMVAIHATNRIVFSHCLDRAELALSSLKTFPEGFKTFTEKLSLFCGGFVSEDFIKFSDMRLMPSFVPIINIDRKNALISWHLPIESAAMKATLGKFEKLWQRVYKRADKLSFETVKPDKVYSYKDILKTLKRLSDDKKWACQDRVPITELFDRIKDLLPEK